MDNFNVDSDYSLEVQTALTTLVIDIASAAKQERFNLWFDMPGVAQVYIRKSERAVLEADYLQIGVKDAGERERRLGCVRIPTLEFANFGIYEKAVWRTLGTPYIEFTTIDALGELADRLDLFFMLENVGSKHLTSYLENDPGKRYVKTVPVGSEPGHTTCFYRQFKASHA